VNSRLEYEEYQRHCFAETLSELQLDDSRKMGYVYKCLATAILCLRYAMRQESSGPIPGGSEIFEGLITRLIMDGGDAVSEIPGSRYFLLRTGTREIKVSRSNLDFCSEGLATLLMNHVSVSLPNYGSGEPLLTTRSSRIRMPAQLVPY
jgi:hypothetical protein